MNWRLERVRCVLSSYDRWHRSERWMTSLRQRLLQLRSTGFLKRQRLQIPLGSLPSLLSLLLSLLLLLRHLRLSERATSF
jgi:hypothetical protein